MKLEQRWGWWCEAAEQIGLADRIRERYWSEEHQHEQELRDIYDGAELRDELDSAAARALRAYEALAEVHAHIARMVHEAERNDGINANMFWAIESLRCNVERMAREIEIEFERFNNARRALERELEIEAERAKRGAR